MTSEPAAPGAPAIILVRSVRRDDSGKTAHEDDYYRIKILTEEGRKYGHVELPYVQGSSEIRDIHARTIKPDGSIVDFDGQVFTKSIVKARGLKYLAKTFSLPEVQPGCVIEYFYTLHLSEAYAIDSHWILSNELFTKAANFSLKPYTPNILPYRLWWVRQNMPAGAPPIKEDPYHIIGLHVANIPAFPTENLMPPEDELKARVDFSYSFDGPDTNLHRFWSNAGKRMNSQLEAFIGKGKSMEQAVSEIVQPNDPPEVKLRKIYARVQQMRETEEEKREKEKEARNVEEVWKRGYADGTQLNWLYLALVRAAGFEAYGVMLADREHYFFDPKLMQSEKLDASLVLVKLNGKDIFCDPGSAFTPFGLLPWPKTRVQGLQLDNNGGTWIQSLASTSEQARTERRADLTLSDTGDLEGKLTVTFGDMEGAGLRREEQLEDETERKSYLENMVKGYIPAASEVKLTNQPDWNSFAAPLVVAFNIKVPGWASGVGPHVMVPVGLFSAREKHVFDPAQRVYPIYVEYPYAEVDDINIQIPAGWQVSRLPSGWQFPGHVSTYSLKVENNKEKLHVARTLTIDFTYLETKYYAALRDYFQQIKTTDEQPIVLERGAARVGN
jgi:hypothetical protein